MVVAFTCFIVAFASAVVTAGLDGPSKTFNVSIEVSLLQITVFVVGFGIGKCIRSFRWLRRSKVNRECQFQLRSNGICASVGDGRTQICLRLNPVTCCYIRDSLCCRPQYCNVDCLQSNRRNCFQRSNDSCRRHFIGPLEKRGTRCSYGCIQCCAISWSRHWSSGWRLSL